MATDHDVEGELLDYDEEETQEQQANGAENAVEKKAAVKGSYVSIHSSGFRDFLLKPELLRAIVDCGFEHPSEGKVIHNFSILVCKENLILLESSHYLSWQLFVSCV